jgi:hypothetical protein
MLRRCPSSPHTGTGWIRGWRLTFGAEELGWEGALATLVPDDEWSDGVFVALYDLTEVDEQALDAWEGADHGLYRKLHLRVHTLAGDVVAYVYVLDAFEGGLPSAIPPRWRADRLHHRLALEGVPLHRSLSSRGGCGMHRRGANRAASRILRRRSVASQFGGLGHPPVLSVRLSLGT